MMGLNFSLLEASDLAGSKPPALCNASTFLVLSGLVGMNLCCGNIRSWSQERGGELLGQQIIPILSSKATGLGDSD